VGRRGVSGRSRVPTSGGRNSNTAAAGRVNWCRRRGQSPGRGSVSTDEMNSARHWRGDSDSALCCYRSSKGRRDDHQDFSEVHRADLIVVLLELDLLCLSTRIRQVNDTDEI
jgi:hypothetical protein